MMQSHPTSRCMATQLRSRSRWQALTAIAIGLAVLVPVALTNVLGPDAASAAVPPPDDRLGGRVTARIGERIVAFPTLKTDVKADISGDIARVTVTQTFLNPANVPLNATYLFPLNRRAAVHHMRMQVADEVVDAVIQKKAEARKTFETAKRAGKAAALLEQHRPNMFTQEIANLMPGVPITITLTYSQTVPRVDGNYELVVPLVVGPRYRPAHQRGPARVAGGAPVVPQSDAPQSDAPQSDAPGVRRDDGGPIVPPQPVPAIPRPDGWQLGPVPKYPEVSGLTVPDTVERDRVSIAVDLISAIPVTEVASATHRLAVTGEGNARRIVLDGGRTIDNRDFVLRYTLAGKSPQAGLLVHRDKRGGYFSLMIEPPAMPAADQIAPREIVFILDTSGSMGGLPIEASKTFMRQALKGLRPADRFRIVTFASQASAFAAQAVSATPENLAAAQRYVEGLRASGGTEVLGGLRLAYGAPLDKAAVRLIVFLSDGYVSNEPEILRMVARHVGHGRMYAFGIGTSVNRYLIAEMARQGRGRHRIIDPTQKAHDEAMAFARTLETPVLTDIRIDWGSLAPADVTPAAIPDLFAGENLRILGRFDKPGAHIIKVIGKVAGREATLPLKIVLPAAAADAPSPIPVLWARSTVADHMHAMMVPTSLRSFSTTDAELQASITKLGLDYALVTQWTSFVAVSARVVNPSPGDAVDTQVPLHQVEGVGPGAYGLPPGHKAGTPANGFQRPMLKARVMPPRAVGGPKYAHNMPTGGFAGGATPEPEHMLGLGLMVLLLLGRFRRRLAQALAEIATTVSGRRRSA